MGNNSCCGSNDPIADTGAHRPSNNEDKHITAKKAHEPNNNEHKISKFDLSEIKKEFDECKSVKDCTCIKKILVALQYYSMLDMVNDIQDRDAFTNFIEQDYHRIFDDYNHLVIKHGNEVNEIDISLIKCDDMKNCMFTQRHQQVAITQEKV
eukprot:372261_1